MSSAKGVEYRVTQTPVQPFAKVKRLFNLKQGKLAALPSSTASTTRCCGCLSAISEDNSFRTVWSMLLLLVLIYVGTWLPFRVCFVEMRIASDDYKSSAFLTVFDYFIDVLFATDVVLNFFLTYRDDGNQEVFDLRRIRIHYLRGFFVLDLIACTPQPLLLLINWSFGAKLKFFTKIARLQRLTRLARLTLLIRFKRQAFKNSLVLWISQWNSMRLVKFCATLFWAVHLLACGWYAVAALHKKPEDTWVARRQIDADGVASLIDRGPAEQWMHGVYFMLTIFTTVGFGDISAFTFGEVTYVSFAMFVGTVLHSVLVSEMIEMISKASAKESETERRLELINHFSLQTGLNDRTCAQLKDRIDIASRNQTLSSSSFDRQALRLLINDGTFPDEDLSLLAREVFNGRLHKNSFLKVCRGNRTRLTLYTAIASTQRMCHVGDVIYRLHDYPTSIFLVDSGVFALVKADDSEAERRELQRTQTEEGHGAAHHILAKSRTSMHLGDGAPGDCELSPDTSVRRNSSQKHVRVRYSPVRLYCRGSCFGAAEFSSRRPRLCSMRCEADGFLLSLDRDSVEQLMVEFPQYRTIWRAEEVRAEMAVRSSVSTRHFPGQNHLHLAATFIQQQARKSWPHFAEPCRTWEAIPQQPCVDPPDGGSEASNPQPDLGPMGSFADVSGVVVQDVSATMHAWKKDVLAEMRVAMRETLQEYGRMQQRPQTQTLPVGLLPGSL